MDALWAQPSARYALARPQSQSPIAYSRTFTTPQAWATGATAAHSLSSAFLPPLGTVGSLRRPAAFQHPGAAAPVLPPFRSGHAQAYTRCIHLRCAACLYTYVYTARKPASCSSIAAQAVRQPVPFSTMRTSTCWDGARRPPVPSHFLSVPTTHAALGRSASAPSLPQPHRAFLCGHSSPSSTPRQRQIAAKGGLPSSLGHSLGQLGAGRSYSTGLVFQHVGHSGCAARSKGLPVPREDLSRVTFGKPSGGGGKLWLCARQRYSNACRPSLVPLPSI